MGLKYLGPAASDSHDVPTLSQVQALIAAGGGVDTTAAHYKGTWSNQAYVANDVVVYQGVTYICTTPITPGARPTFVASGSNAGASSYNLAIPSGAVAGDLAIVSLTAYTGGSNSVPNAPSGFTTLASLLSSNSAGSLGVYGKVLTSTDISTGSVALPTQPGNFAFPSTIHVYRGATMPTQVVTTTTNTTATITPTSDSLIHDAASGLQGGATQSSLSAYLGLNNATSGLYIYSGYENGTSGVATTARTFSGITSYMATASVVVSSGNGSFPSSNFTAIGYSAGKHVQQTLTSATTLSQSNGDTVLCNASSGAFAVTLPSTTQPGLRFVIKKIDSSANAVTVVGTIDGATNYSLAAQYKYVVVESTSTAGTYYVVGSN